MPKAVQFTLRCIDEKIQFGNHAEIVTGIQVDFAMVVPFDDCYIDIYELPSERFVQYDQTDGPWLEYFGKAKIVGRSGLIGLFQEIDLYPFLGVAAQGVVSEAKAWSYCGDRAGLFRGQIVNPSIEVVRLAKEIQKQKSAP